MYEEIIYGPRSWRLRIASVDSNIANVYVSFLLFQLQSPQ